MKRNCERKVDGTLGCSVLARQKTASPKGLGPRWEKEISNRGRGKTMGGNKKEEKDRGIRGERKAEDFNSRARHKAPSNGGNSFCFPHRRCQGHVVAGQEKTGKRGKREGGRKKPTGSPVCCCLLGGGAQFRSKKGGGN